MRCVHGFAPRHFATATWVQPGWVVTNRCSGRAFLGSQLTWQDLWTGQNDKSIWLRMRRAAERLLERDSKIEMIANRTGY